MLFNLTQVMLSQSPHLLMHNDLLTYPGGAERPGDLNDLTQMANFLTRILDCDSHSLVLLGFFLSSDPSICFTVAFPKLGNSDHAAVSVSIVFPLNLQGDACD